MPFHPGAGVFRQPFHPNFGSELPGRGAEIPRNAKSLGF